MDGDDAIVGAPQIGTYPPPPTLQILAASVVAGRIESYECPALPYGCGPDMIRRLAATGRLRAETLAPLLRSFSVADDLEAELGQSLTHLALGCHGGRALAAQVLRSREAAKRGRQRRDAREVGTLALELDLPEGSRISRELPEGRCCDLRVETMR